MQYNAPPGALDPNAPYSNGIPGIKKGSPVNAHAAEYPQREIIHVIEQADIVPSNADLTQLYQAIQSLIARNRQEKYRIGEIYGTDELTPDADSQLAYGGLFTGASSAMPQLYAYLQTPSGQSRCVSEAQWQALSTAAGGVGGAWKFVLDTAANTIRLPDVRGDAVEFSGHGGLLPGAWHGDAIREMTGATNSVQYVSANTASGVFELTDTGGRTNVSIQSSGSILYQLSFKASKTVPVADRVQVRSGIKLPCVYVGGEA